MVSHDKEAFMLDLIFSLATLFFFWLSALYLRACDRLK
jgi:hypothetical protein